MPKTESNPIKQGQTGLARRLHLQPLSFRGPDPRRTGEIHERLYAGKGLAVVAINSNDAAAHPEESLERVGAEVKSVGYGFPYLKDASQAIAKAYGAACTPDFFLYDHEHRLAYHGQFDEARPGNGKPVTGADLRVAVDAILAGAAVGETQIPSIGCNIKWAPGNEPSWFSTAA